jgi:hypothetical protein
VAALLLVCQPAFAQKRVALVIGNSAYQNVVPLANPINDAAVIAATLKNAGFDVVDSRHDLPAAETRHALRDFADRASDADIAVVYYAGHGIEVDGANYLIPVDAKLGRDTDVYDEALSLDRILIAIEPAKKLRLVILDACRDNPFTKTMKRTVASRAIGQGLAKVEPTSPNVLIAYSAKAGSTATPDDAGPRRAPCVWIRPRRRAQEYRQPAGTVRLWLARRRGCAAGAGAEGCTCGGNARGAARVQSAGRSPSRLRTRAADRQQEGARRFPRAISRRLLRQSRQASA